MSVSRRLVAEDVGGGGWVMVYRSCFCTVAVAVEGRWVLLMQELPIQFSNPAIKSWRCKWKKLKLDRDKLPRRAKRSQHRSRTPEVQNLITTWTMSLPLSSGRASLWRGTICLFFSFSLRGRPRGELTWRKISRRIRGRTKRTGWMSSQYGLLLGQLCNVGAGNTLALRIAFLRQCSFN